MKLEALFRDIPVQHKINWAPQKTFRNITSDSRVIEKGDIFVACRGVRMDGHDFLNQAIHAGAKVVVFENVPDMIFPVDVTAIQVKNSPACLARLLNRLYDYPDRQVKLVGITGTNGKTTISYLIHQLLSRQSTAAYLGTLWYDLPSQRLTAPNTTPAAEVLIPLLHSMRERDVRYCVAEVSSHALNQQRVHGLGFELAAFTQLTQDHLDYHGSMENYYRAKRELFAGSPPPRLGLVNADCPYGKRLLAEFPYSKGFSLSYETDFYAKEIESSFRGSTFKFCYGEREIPVRIQLPMKHNVLNTVCVLSALQLLGFPPEECLPALEDMAGIPGRLERMNRGGDFDVFVDYAHTPDAFENVLSGARLLSPRRILTLFGCGGDRDRGKRPLMADIACKYSDLCVFTSDNPRSEDPVSIIRDMRKGLPAGESECRTFELLDREEAIYHIISLAQPGDVVFILGKGHEDYQILGDRKVPFDDRVIAREALKRKGRVFSP